MNNTFVKSFVNTLIFNIATIAAIVVGVVKFTYTAVANWYKNGGKQVMINNACKVLMFVNKSAEQVYYHLEDADIAAV